MQIPLTAKIFWGRKAIKLVKKKAFEISTIHLHNFVDGNRVIYG